MDQKKRKISLRKVLQAFVTIVVTTGCLFAILSASEANHQRNIRRIDIQITNAGTCQFLTPEKIRSMVMDNRNIVPEETPAAAIDLERMEAILKSNPWISDATIYLDNAYTLHINVKQRVPVVRVFEEEDNSYYLDSEGNILPLSNDYTHYSLVITGVPELRNDSTKEVLVAHLLKLAKTIQEDEFWNLQVSSVKMNSEGKFELVPVVGKHRILIGDTSRLEEKLSHIRAFYQQVLNRIGWEMYQTIDARFRGQIVASPSLPWKAPRDKAMGDMNWVNSIINNAPADRSAPAPTSATTPAATAPARPATTAIQSVQEIKTVEKPQAAANAPEATTNSGAREKMPAQPKTTAPKPTNSGTEKIQVATEKPQQTKKKEVKTELNDNNAQPKYLYEGN